MNYTLEGWNIGHNDEQSWSPWGAPIGKARAKVLAVADDYYVTLVEASAGYSGDAHEHAFPEFLFVIDGQLHTQGITLGKGDGYAAETGSVHSDFETDTDSTYLIIFKI